MDDLPRPGGHARRKQPQKEVGLHRQLVQRGLPSVRLLVCRLSATERSSRCSIAGSGRGSRARPASLGSEAPAHRRAPVPSPRGCVLNGPGRRRQPGDLVAGPAVHHDEVFAAGLTTFVEQRVVTDHVSQDQLVRSVRRGPLGSVSAPRPSARSSTIVSPSQPASVMVRGPELHGAATRLLRPRACATPRRSRREGSTRPRGSSRRVIVDLDLRHERVLGVARPTVRPGQATADRPGDDAPGERPELL